MAFNFVHYFTLRLQSLVGAFIYDFIWKNKFTWNRWKYVFSISFFILWKTKQVLNHMVSDMFSCTLDVTICAGPGAPAVFNTVSFPFILSCLCDTFKRSLRAMELIILTCRMCLTGFFSLEDAQDSIFSSLVLFETLNASISC